MGLFATVWKYRTISDHRIAGQRFVIEEAYNDQNDSMGYEYSVDGLDVTPMVFDRAIEVAKLASAVDQRQPKRRVA
jgi:hypothetical protein